MPAKILGLDIETSPNICFTWGLFKQNIAINQIVKPGGTLCWGAKWFGDKEVLFNSTYVPNQKDLTKSELEIALYNQYYDMMEEIWYLLDEADIVIHYNGKKFDIPTLNREFVQLGWPPPSTYKQIDLYHVVRRQFRFASNKLDFICQQLGLGNKVQHKGMDLWAECMEGIPSAWKVMKEYNIQDVNLMEPLYEILVPWIPNHPNMGLWIHNDEEATCPKCGSTHLHKKGKERTQTMTYQRYLCLGCGATPRGRKSLHSPRAGLLVGG